VQGRAFIPDPLFRSVRLLDLVPDLRRAPVHGRLEDDQRVAPVRPPAALSRHARSRTRVGAERPQAGGGLHLAVILWDERANEFPHGLARDPLAGQRHADLAGLEPRRLDPLERLDVCLEPGIDAGGRAGRLELPQHVARQITVGGFPPAIRRVEDSLGQRGHDLLGGLPGQPSDFVWVDPVISVQADVQGIVGADQPLRADGRPDGPPAEDGRLLALLVDQRHQHGPHRRLMQLSVRLVVWRSPALERVPVGTDQHLPGSE
jgi:hypothetical protein